MFTLSVNSFFLSSEALSVSVCASCVVASVVSFVEEDFSVFFSDEELEFNNEFTAEFTTISVTASFNVFSEVEDFFPA